MPRVGIPALPQRELAVHVALRAGLEVVPAVGSDPLHPSGGVPPSRAGREHVDVGRRGERRSPPRLGRATRVQVPTDPRRASGEDDDPVESNGRDRPNAASSTNARENVRAGASGHDCSGSRPSSARQANSRVACRSESSLIWSFRRLFPQPEFATVTPKLVNLRPAETF